MSVYKRGDAWWYKFRFAGQVIRESTKSDSRTVARAAEHARRRALEQGFNRIERQRAAQPFSVAAEDWLDAKKAHLALRSVAIERANLKHLNPFFGKMLLCDIRSDDVARYQAARLQGKAAPKTVNLEIGTLRAVLCDVRTGFIQRRSAPMHLGIFCDRQTVGLLQRRHIKIDLIKCIGKESNSLENVDQGMEHSENNVYTEYADPKRSEWVTKLQPALKRAKLRKLIRECGKKLSRREIIELRAGRSKRPHRKNQELLVAILRKFGRI